MKGILRVLGWSAMGLVVQLRCYKLLAAAYSRIVEELHPDGTVSRGVTATVGDRPTVLVLSKEQFRGDIEDLAATGDIRVLQLAERWLTRLMFQFYPVEIGQDSYRHYFNPTEADRTWQPKWAYRAFLRQFLPVFLDRLGVQVLIGHHIHYIPDFDWGAVADELDYPFVVINRENLFGTKDLQDFVHERISTLGKFEGRYVTVHNRVAKELFSGSGFVDEEKLKILGCIRMDHFLQSIKTAQQQKIDRVGERKMAFFAFATDPAILETVDVSPLFVEVCTAIIETAFENPSLQITVKVKPNLFNSWKLQFADALPEYADVFETTANLHLSNSIPAHQLIAESGVIVGLNSTTLAEAAVAGCQVIVPYYGPLRETKYDNRIFFREDMGLFHVPNDVHEFKRMLLECFEAPPASAEVTAARSSLFDEYVSSLDGLATQRHIELLQDLWRESKIPIGKKDALPSASL